MDGRSSEADANSRAAKLARDLATREQELSEQRRELRMLRAENGELKQRVGKAEEEAKTLNDRLAAAEQAAAAASQGEVDKRVAYLQEQIVHLQSLMTQLQGERDFYNDSYCNAQLELEKCQAAVVQASNNETIANAHLADARNQLATMSNSHRQDSLALGQQKAATEELARELETYKQKELELAALVAATQTQLQKAQKQTAEMHETMLIRDETIAGLRRELAKYDQQLREASKPYSKDYTQLLEEIDEGKREIDKLNAEKQRLQTTIALNKEVLADTDVKMVELQRELLKERGARQALAKKGLTVSDESRVRKLLDEIHTLKLENAQLSTQSQGVLTSPGGANSLEAERLKARRAEASLRALQKRVSYLLQLTEHSNKLAARWQEQKQLLKAQITGLSRANQDLRSRLLQLESDRDDFRPTFQTEVDVSVETSGGRRKLNQTQDDDDDDDDEEEEEEGEADHGGLDTTDNTLNSKTGKQTSRSVAALLEQTIFDTTIAFASGTQSRHRSGGRNSSIPKLSLVTKADGTLEVHVEPNDVSGHELVSKLQLKSFVRFCQSTSSTNPVKACLEKMVAVINATRQIEQQAIHKASRSKTECAKLAAQLVAWQLRLAGLKQFWNETKLSRHKTTIKYVKELLARSSTASHDQPALNDSLGSSRSAATGSPAAEPPDVRLAGCMMDDETLYNVLRVIGGTLDDRETNLTGLGPKLQNAMLDQPIILMNFGHVASLVRLDLSNNYLTDMAAKLLAELVERATSLSYLDLQQNCITLHGVNLLKEAVRRNKTILYCSTFHGGLYLEGVRETALPERNTIAATLSEPRTTKPSLTVDIRQCDPDKELLLLSIGAAVQEAAELDNVQNTTTLTHTGRPPSSRRSMRNTSPLSRATSPVHRRPASSSMKRPRSALVHRPRHMSSKPGQLCTDDDASEEGSTRVPRNKLGGMLDERIRAMEQQGITRTPAASRPHSAPSGRSVIGGARRAATPPASRQQSPNRRASSPFSQLSPNSTRSRTPDRRSPGLSNLTQRTVDAYQGRPSSATVRESRQRHTTFQPSPHRVTAVPKARTTTPNRGIRGIRGHKPVHGVLF